jgi:hypothetical protein
MWMISLLEMWLYKPVFVSGLGIHYLQWRDNVKSETVGKIADYLFNLIRKIHPIHLSKQAFEIALPLLKKLWDFLLSKLQK